MRLRPRVDALERFSGSAPIRLLRLVFQFGGMSRAEAFERHESQNGSIGDDDDVMVVRGVRPGHVEADTAPALH